MGRVSRASLALMAVALCAACSGGGLDDPGSTPTAGGPVTPDVQTGDEGATVTGAQRPTLLREVFTYEGGERDPFRSLITTEEIKPDLRDLRLVSVVYDAAYPARSIAIFRDQTDNQQYRLKQGDVAGRIQITQIRPHEVIVTVREFGFERQETLTLRTRETRP